MIAQTLPLHFRQQAERFASLPAQFSKDTEGTFRPVTFRELQEEVTNLGYGLMSIGVHRGDHVGLISDNRKEWLATDLAVLSLGAADVPRGCDSTEQEIAYILGFADCRLSVAENARQAEKILAGKGEMPLLSTLILFEGDTDSLRKAAGEKGVELLGYGEVIRKGRKYRQSSPGAFEAEISLGTRDDIATIIFTSGTTGEPKGVMLTHGNFLYQLGCIPGLLTIKPGEIWLSVLPVWHSFERIIQYVAIDTGTALAYSKPVASVMLADLKAIRPQWMCSVPRIWEAVRDGVLRNIRAQGPVTQTLFGLFLAIGEAHAYIKNMFRGLIPNFYGRSRIAQIMLAAIPLALLAPLNALGNALVFRKVKEKLGGRIVAVVSGGGALPPQVDAFFAGMGVLILEGYGLTETAPVIAVRNQHYPVPGTVGRYLTGCEVRIADEKNERLPAGRKGLIMIRGPQVMKGYYKRDDLTAKVLSPDGWFNTGDLGMLTRQGEIRITGRAKDTIVLRGGENVEPAPIEQRICESPYVEQCVVLGQDQRFLGALIVPREDTVTAWAKENHLALPDYRQLLASPAVTGLINGEITRLVSPKNGFKSFERVSVFRLLETPFREGVELSHKQEVMRHKIPAIYRKDIESMFR